MTKKAKAPAKTTSPDATKAGPDGVITLKELCADFKIDPYDARVKLRAAVKDKRELGHKAKKAWEWTKGSPELDEARKVLRGE